MACDSCIAFLLGDPIAGPSVYGFLPDYPAICMISEIYARKTGNMRHGSIFAPISEFMHI